MHDEELRTAFHELRAHTERTAPPFCAPAVQRLNTRSDGSSSKGWIRRPHNRVLRHAAVVTLVVAGAGGLLWMRGAQSGKRPASLRDVDATILKWTAPTDVLLQTPGRELLAATPVLTESVVRPGAFTKRY